MTSSGRTDRSTLAATWSLWSITATVIFAAVTHAYDFGIAAAVAGGAVIAILFALYRRYRRTGSRLALGSYGLLSLWVIGGFGLVGGVWNHAVKIALSAANGGTLSPALEPFFMAPELGDGVYEMLWILLGGASLVAAFFGYRFFRTVRWTATGREAA